MNLRISNLSKTYKNGIRALNNIDLDISSGIFGLLGPNGAGKSTLMRTIATLQKPDEGTIFLDSTDVLHEPGKLRNSLGYLPQDFGVYPELTLSQMLNQIAVYKGIIDKTERSNSIDWVLERTNLQAYTKQKLGGFSGGMKQRFGIAQALLGNPDLIIADEPSAGLDPLERNRFHNLLSDLSDDRIVIFSTHIVDDISQLCNRLAIINNGEIIKTGQTTSLVDSIQGRLWQKTIPKKHFDDYELKYDIVFKRLVAGQILLHVESSSKPDKTFASCKPELEDIYFSVVQNGARVEKAAWGHHD